MSKSIASSKVGPDARQPQPDQPDMGRPNAGLLPDGELAGATGGQGLAAVTDGQGPSALTPQIFQAICKNETI